MKKSSLTAVSLFLSVSTALAQEDSLCVPLPLFQEETPTVNRNNIRFVDLGTYSNSVHDTIGKKVEIEQELSPTFLDSYSTSSLWKQGWFFGASAAASAFVGDPIGCDDLFGRVKPALQLSVGKWLIPTAGIRLQYQGMDLKNGNLEAQQYHALMADLMLDIVSFWYKGVSSPRTTVMPFVGCGYMLNRNSCAHAFGLHYGLIGSLRLSRNFHLNMELSGHDTMKDFDGIGDRCSLGDQLLTASLGLTYTIGNKHGRTRVIDAEPYMEQNSRLLNTLNDLSDENRYLLSELNEKNKSLAEYRKILEIKGWLSSVSTGKQEGPARSKIGYPYNNYSGLNALRERLRTKEYSMNLEEDLSLTDAQVDSEIEGQDNDNCRTEGNGKEKMTRKEYMNLLLRRKACIGSPILFFFELNSTQLTDMSQLVNLKEIAEVAIWYQLKVRIIGAADSATGSELQNKDLSTKRADYIATELLKLGVSEQYIQKQNLGGIDRYEPSIANRNTRVELYL